MTESGDALLMRSIIYYTVSIEPPSISVVWKRMNKFSLFDGNEQSCQTNVFFF